MIFSNVLNATKNFSAKIDVRYYLKSIALYFNDKDQLAFVVATNGNVLAITDIKQENREKLKKCDCVVVCSSFLPKLIALYGDLESDLIKKDMIDQAWIVDARYPDITRVIPDTKREFKGGEGLEIGLNVKFLGLLEKFNNQIKKEFKKNKKYLDNYRFNFGDANGAMMARTTLYTDNVTATYATFITLIVMPCKL